MVGPAASRPRNGHRARIERQKMRWKWRSTNARRAEAYPCVLAGLVPANYVASTPPPAENMNHQRYQGKDQKQMNQKARDMVHDEASNPSKNQQHSDGEPDEPTHKPSNESPLQYEPEELSIQTFALVGRVGERSKFPAWGRPYTTDQGIDVLPLQFKEAGR